MQWRQFRSPLNSSEMEIMATVQGQPCIGPWLLEGVSKGRLPVVVARALVEPKAGCVPLHLVNPRSEPMTILILDADASDIGIGAALSKADEEGRERVVAYGSWLLSKSKRKCHSP